MEQPNRNTTVYCDSNCIYSDEDGICTKGSITLDETGQCEDAE